MNSDFNGEHYRILYELEELGEEELKENWLSVGIPKGRSCNIFQAYPDFNHEIYRELYDLHGLSKEELQIHWLQVGRVKRRKYDIFKAYPDFNEEMYRLLHDDLKDYSSTELQIHWLSIGRKEGRTYEFNIAYPNFDEQIYKGLYDDVQDLSSDEIIRHWLEIGRKEGRTYEFSKAYPDFNESRYKKIYSLEDMKTDNEYISDISSVDVRLHWLIIGRNKVIEEIGVNEEIKEEYLDKSIIDNILVGFDESMYRALYDDLKELSSEEIKLHWLQIGRKEGRTYHFYEVNPHVLYSLG